MAGHDITPFTIDVSADVLDDLRERLARTRWPADPDADNETWRYGVNKAYLKGLVAHWLGGYDWPATQAAMNAFPNYRVVVDDQPIHFVHVRGKGPNPQPLILTHGFPWTYWDYRKVIGPLTDPAAHGGDPADAFDVIVPSLPGYGFSNPARKGVSARQTADLWVKLMRDVLGYDRFISAGTDWGAVISVMLGYLYPKELKGIYVTTANFGPVLRNRFEGWDMSDLEPDEKEWFDREWRHKKGAGQVFRGPGNALRSPQTESYGGHDSPVALLTRIADTRHFAGDTHGDIASTFTADELITNTMIYWVTETWWSAQRFYFNTARDTVPPFEGTGQAITTPTGMGLFPAEVFYVPKKLAQRDANIVHWSYLSAGGHFACGEQPVLYVDDLRTFCRKLT
ncbi:MAG: epoxide hydrolase family protein [Acidimicrobiia bacterium]